MVFLHVKYGQISEFIGGVWAWFSENSKEFNLLDIFGKFQISAETHSTPPPSLVRTKVNHKLPLIVASSVNITHNITLKSLEKSFR